MGDLIGETLDKLNEILDNKSKVGIDNLPEVLEKNKITDCIYLLGKYIKLNLQKKYPNLFNNVYIRFDGYSKVVNELNKRIKNGTRDPKDNDPNLVPAFSTNLVDNKYKIYFNLNSKYLYITKYLVTILFHELTHILLCSLGESNDNFDYYFNIVKSMNKELPMEDIKFNKKHFSFSQRLKMAFDNTGFKIDEGPIDHSKEKIIHIMYLGDDPVMKEICSSSNYYKLQS